MRRTILSAIAALALTLGAAAPGAAALLGVSTGAPSVEASGDAVFGFDQLTFTGGVGATSGASVADASSINFLIEDDPLGDFFANIAVFGGLGEVLFQTETVVATGFDAQSIEVLFGPVEGDAAGDLPLDKLLLTVSFTGPDAPARTGAGIFEGLAFGTAYDVNVVAAAVIPLPAPILLLGAGLIALGGVRFARRRHA